MMRNEKRNVSDPFDQTPLISDGYVIGMAANDTNWRMAA